MQRRDFINLTAVSAGASLVVPVSAAFARSKDNAEGGVYFTKKNPGRWSNKVGGHLPNIKIKKYDNKINITVTTAHAMDGYAHYIVKHVLLDQNYNFLDEKMFDPTKDQVPVSNFTLENYKGYVHLLSMCNKHDVWLSGKKVW
ncbi:MAG: hypothetical protein HFP77_09215 [Methylococcales symbiont of Iophon sp. n. MRB-2018]|nr:MAG: hypothetical protein HFP77_09215 [Methylococcales symbiont of Iophon sp. n. MRB-2018]KAF3978886.1 MAG: hypothetical protein HFP76_10410 [Methylococcales symbiont of Iophon sp. n. MRB-2018]